MSILSILLCFENGLKKAINVLYFFWELIRYIWVCALFKVDISRQFIIKAITNYNIRWNNKETNQKHLALGQNPRPTFLRLEAGAAAEPKGRIQKISVLCHKSSLRISLAKSYQNNPFRVKQPVSSFRSLSAQFWISISTVWKQLGSRVCPFRFALHERSTMSFAFSNYPTSNLSVKGSKSE